MSEDACEELTWRPMEEVRVLGLTAELVCRHVVFPPVVSDLAGHCSHCADEGVPPASSH